MANGGIKTKAKIITTTRFDEFKYGMAMATQETMQETVDLIVNKSASSDVDNPVPEITGRLRNSAEGKARTDKNGIVKARVQWRTPYASLVNNGGMKNVARHYVEKFLQMIANERLGSYRAQLKTKVTRRLPKQ